MASRRELTMLQNLNRRLATSLWSVPPQWRALRRVPGWSYSPSAVKRIRPPHEFLYEDLFARLPMLRLEGYRLGETPLNAQGTANSSRSLTQRMVLRWWHLIRAEGMKPTLAFEQLQSEFRTRLDEYTRWLTTARAEALDRHQRLQEAKLKKDARDVELGRPERYAEKLEGLVNRALNLQPTESRQYFSQAASRKLIKLLNKEQVRANLTLKTAEVKRQIDDSELGRQTRAMIEPARAAFLVQEQQRATEHAAAVAASHARALNSGTSSEISIGGVSAADAAAAGLYTSPAATASPASYMADFLSSTSSSSAAAASPTASSGLGEFTPKPVPSDRALLPTDARGAPVASPQLFLQVEKDWSTSIHNGDKASVGVKKDQRVTELLRHLDAMQVDDGATLPDYLAYVLYTQIVRLRAKRLLHWQPYTQYLDQRVFFHAYRLLHTGLHSSSVHTDVVTGADGAAAGHASFVWPKVRHAESGPLNFQQAATHARLLVLLQNHLQSTPLVSFAEAARPPPPPPEGDNYLKERELPLTPFWQSVMDEKVRFKHPGESWYNARIEERVQRDSLLQERQRLEAEAKQRWLADKARQMEQQQQEAQDK